VKKNFLIGKYLVKLQARTWLSRALVQLANTLLKDGERQNYGHESMAQFFDPPCIQSAKIPVYFEVFLVFRAETF